MTVSEALRKTIEYAALETDERGLLPLAKARAILAATDVYPGAPVHEGRTPEETIDVATSHAIHAALVSLDSADEALGHLTRLTFGKPLYDATTLIERYGASMLPWLAGTIEAGVLQSKSWELEPALAQLGTEDAFELLLKLTVIAFDYAPRKAPTQSIAAIPELDPKARVDIRVVRGITQFLTTNPIVAARVLARRMAKEPKSKRWKEIARELPETPEVLEVLGGPIPPEPATPKLILAVLDAAAKEAMPDSWPKFATGIEDDPAGYEYFALRLIGVRAKVGDHWGVALERISGSFSPWQPTRVERFLYGSRIRDAGRASEKPIAFELDRIPDHANGEKLGIDVDGVTVSGPAGKLTLSTAMVSKLDFEPGLGSEAEGDPGYNLRLRAYLAVHPAAFWEPASVAAAALGIPDGDVLVDTHAFAHASGASYKRGTKSAWQIVPSKSETYQSLAAAIAKRDAKLFVPGQSNVDSRIHATTKMR
jgi:hypothetical protein